MFKKVLIANRGEIAVRIIRACRNMGIVSVAVYSKEDKTALHVQLADQRICIGEGNVRESYLNMDRIITAAMTVEADAIHPGYGFLSENSGFAKKCNEMGIVFIGPSALSIDMMGNKSSARKTMMDAGIPVTPGSREPVYDVKEAKKEARNIGYPIMIKASSGGGGKGMRAVFNEGDFDNQFELAQRESANAFGDDSMYLEKLIEHPRHVEVQILADNYGHVIALGERDCSVQRNHQKLIEESPSPAVNRDIRKRMCKDAVRAASVTDYRGAGTIEYMMDENGNYYFMEMNTRIQVEHGVTELVSGVDLVEEQIRIAAGEELKIKQEDISLRGHALECRINAEIPERNFMPSPGRVEHLHFPGGNGVRVDTALYTGYDIPSEYDSMIAKILVYGEDRESAIMRMRAALDETLILGVETNLDFQYLIMQNDTFINGKADTDFIEKFLSKRR